MIARFPRHFGAVGLLALILILASGCGPSDPLDNRFSIDQAADFTQQRSLLPRGLTTGQLKDFDEAILALKYEVITKGEAKGSDAVMDEVVAQIKGRSLREIIGMGLAARVRRLEAERSKLQEVSDHNARLKTRPGDHASADFLNSVRDEHTRRLEKIEEDLSQTRRKMAELAGQKVSP